MDVYVLLAFGIGVLVWSIVTFIKRFKLYKKGRRIKGKIIEFRKTEETILETWNYSERVVLNKPIIEVTYEDNNMIFYYDEEVDKNKYSIGDEIDVIYDKQENDIYLDSKIEFFRVPGFLFLLSILLSSFSLTLYLFK